MTTVYHSKYWAHALTLKGSSDSIDNLSRSISNARVDLNPHQIDAALFALRSPLSHGAILADEVGLGKTIEAGLVLSQRWAERKRKILVIVPATLRTQWQQELGEKFFLPSLILESRNFNALRANGYPNPFDQDNQLVICSYHFASAKAEEISRVPWDMVVIDEAHRLRNVYRSGNKMAKAIAAATENRFKLLLTATPLQNNLLELYGLVSVIDPHVFGSEVSFRDRFMRNGHERDRNRALRDRLEAICTRTLRKHVLEYVSFTQRVPMREEFKPYPAEQGLYDAISNYLSRETLIALPASQRALMSMVLRKSLASSSFALSATLRKMIGRLEEEESTEASDLSEDFETLDELEDEWDDTSFGPYRRTDTNPALLEEELSILRNCAALAESIRDNAKGDALVRALTVAFDEAVNNLGANRKAVIFTESRRTQEYLASLLIRNGYGGKVVTLNGTNNDPRSQEIYERWRSRHPESSRRAGSKAVDLKTAIIEHFRDNAEILVATEAAGEGINLQFCSLVVNYDLPWNPQRVEQRIGRCHRYGQKHDVVVVNFFNQTNAADQRVLELLTEKFQLFSGVFGASDEVLGALESGVDLEQRIAHIYQTCRTADEIEQGFAELRASLDEQIQARMAETRQRILDNFDEDVTERLKVHRRQALARLSERERWLLNLAKVELCDDARFAPEEPCFQYYGDEAPRGSYHLNWESAEQHGDIFFRLDHPLAERIIARSADRNLPTAHLEFNYDAYGARISRLKHLIGASGWLEVSKVRIESVDVEEHMVIAAFTDQDRVLDQGICRSLVNLPARIVQRVTAEPPTGRLNVARKRVLNGLLEAAKERSAQYFDEEVTKLDRWSEDLRLGLEREITDLQKEIRELSRTKSLSNDLSEKLVAEKKKRDVERRRNQKRRELYAAQDEIEEQRNELIAQIERQLQQRHSHESLFTIRWTLT